MRKTGAFEKFAVLLRSKTAFSFKHNMHSCLKSGIVTIGECNR